MTKLQLIGLMARRLWPAPITSDQYNNRIWHDEHFYEKDYDCALYWVSRHVEQAGHGVYCQAPKQLVLDHLLKWQYLPLYYRLTVPVTRFLYMRGWLGWLRLGLRPRQLWRTWRDRNQPWPVFEPGSDNDIPF
jgi:hypothetical protein